MARATAVPFDLVLSDYRMPVMDGVDFLTRLKATQPDTMRLILSGYSDLKALLQAINEAEIHRFISKPWNDYELKSTIALALAHRATRLENKRLADQVRAQQSQLEDLLGKLEAEAPGITKVCLDEDGAIVIDGVDDFTKTVFKSATDIIKMPLSTLLKPKQPHSRPKE